MKPNSQKIYQIIVGALVYGILNWLFSKILLPAAPIIALRPQVAVPMFMGLIFGPTVGFFSGCLGNALGDLFIGYGITFWNWHIANGLLGLIPGCVHFLGIKDIRSVLDFGIIELSVVLGSIIAIGFACTLDVFVIRRFCFSESLGQWFLPAALTDVINGLILIPILLLAWKRLVMTLERPGTIAS